MYIYKITNLINNKIYIGKHSKDNPNYFGSGINLSKAIKKYGIKNFKKEIIEDNINNKNLLNEKEKYYIKLYNSTNNKIGYNISVGGDGGDNYTFNPNKKEIAKKIRNRLIGSALSQETKNKISNSHKGKIATLETRLKISKSMMGEKNPHYGHKHTEEIKKMIGLKNKGRLLGKIIAKTRMVKNITTGIIFKSISEAGRFYKMKSHSNIATACKNSNYTCYGYKWEYIN